MYQLPQEEEDKKKPHPSHDAGTDEVARKFLGGFPVWNVRSVVNREVTH